MPVELALLGVIVLLGAVSAGVGEDSLLFTRLISISFQVGCSSSTSGKG